MSESVQIALITIIPATLAAIFSYLASRRAAESRNVALATQAIAQKTEENTNHMKDELVAAVKDAALQRGHAEGKLEAQNEAKDMA